MTTTLNSGPLVIAGNMMDSVNGSPQIEYPDAGPSLFYQGVGFPDVRFGPINKDYSGNVAVCPSMAVVQDVLSVDAIPATLGTAKIAALANVSTGVAMTLAAASAGISVAIPFQVFGGAIITANIALDFGFDTLNCTSGTASVVVADSTIYTAGMPVIVAGVGNSGGTIPLITYIKSITDLTHIVLNTAPLATNSAARVGTGNAWGIPQNKPPFVSTAALPYLEQGFALMYDGRQGISRGVSITGVTSGTGGNFTVVGYDVYGRLQTEVIAVASGVNTVNSKKTYKYIQSVTPTFTDAHNYSVGTSDIYGFAVRADRFEQTLIYYAGALITASTGFTTSDKATATTTTGDPRGTYALQSASNGTNRLTIYQMPGLINIRSSPVNPTKLYGVTPA